MFNDRSFDVIIVSHVIEHLATPYLDLCLSELSRVGNYCLIYLPIAGWHFQLHIKMDIKNINLSFTFDIFNFFHKPDSITPRYCSGQHYWEIGMRGFKVTNLTKRFSKYFKVLSTYRNKD